MAGPLTLTEHLKSLGNAEILISTTGITGPVWTNLGAMEGDRRFEVSYSNNPLTAPEYTGGIAHEMTTILESARITGSVIVGDADLWAKINPYGIKGGGYSAPRKPVEFAVVIIPRSELGDDLTNDDGTTSGWSRVPAGGGTAVTGASAAPVNAIWIPRATVSHGPIPFSEANGGKSLVDVTFEAMFYAPAGEGYQVYAIGDPNRVDVAYGVEMD